MILDGKKCAEDAERALVKNVQSPYLAIITVGNDPASKVYVRNKINAAGRCGITVKHFVLPADATQAELVLLVSQLSDDDLFNGIIIQLPLPPQMSAEGVLSYLNPAKDVDGFRADSKFAPCTPAGCLALLKYYNFDVSGKHCIIINRSKIVGLPLAHMLLAENATVTVCHSHTSSEILKKLCLSADFIFSAAGVPNLITPDMVTESTVLIDIAMNRDSNGKLCGDVSHDCYPIVQAYTPVPGGIGPMTVNQLMKNVTEAANNAKI